MTSGARSDGIHATSPPAEKARPEPVSTTARAADSVLSVRNSSPSSRVQPAVDGVHRRFRVVDGGDEHVPVAFEPDRLHRRNLLPTTARIGRAVARLCRGVDLGEPAGLGLLVLPSPRRGSRGDLRPRTGHPHRRPVRPPLQATSTNSGYRISGRAPFVSNCYDADWILSMVVVDEDESAAPEPEMRMVYFVREQCELVDTWDVMGMRRTGSNDISVTDVYVPESRTFPFVPDFEPGSDYRGPLYRLPVVGVAATGIPTPMLGVAGRALDEVTALARSKTVGGIERSADGAVVGPSPAGPSGGDLALGSLLLLESLPRSVAEMPGRRDPLTGAEGGPPAGAGPRHEQRRPGGGTGLQHRGNDGVSSPPAPWSVASGTSKP